MQNSPSPLSVTKTELLWKDASRAEKLLVWGFLLSLSLDYKGEEGGSLFQVIYFALAVLFGTALCLRSPVMKIKSVPMSGRYALRFYWVYIFSTALTAFAMEIAWDRYGRVITPFLLFGLAFAVVRSVAKRGGDICVFYKPLLYGATVTLISTFIHGMAEMDAGLMSRYHLVSSALPIILLYAVIAFIKGKAKLIHYIALASTTSLLLLSVTRTYLMAAGIAVILGFVSASGKAGAFKRLVRLLGLLILSLIVLFLVDTYLLNGIATWWVERIVEGKTDSGADVTYLMRLGEYKWQIDALMRDLPSLIFGKGVGSSYGFDYGEHYRSLASLLGPLDTGPDVWYAGHSLWVYSLYSSGLIFGLMVPLLFMLMLSKSLKIVVSRTNVHSTLRAEFLLLAALSFIFYFVASFFSHPFVSRYNALLLGILFGVVFFYRSEHSSRQKRRFPAASRRFIV